MDGTQIVDGLDFPEGPVWLDGVLWFTEIMGGHLFALDAGRRRRADRQHRRRPERRHGRAVTAGST